MTALLEKTGKVKSEEYYICEGCGLKMMVNYDECYVCGEEFVLGFESESDYTYEEDCNNVSQYLEDKRNKRV